MVPKIEISYQDLPDVSETFADSVEKISFDGQSWRVEFCITRMNEPRPPIISGKKYPACRLVLTPNAGIDLANKLKGIVEQMEKQGLIKVMPNPNLTVPPGTKPN
jgi:hypothetical protein